MLRKSLVARATQTIATVMSSGVPLLEAVRLTREATEHTVMREALTRIETDLLQGRGFSEALVSTTVFPPLLIEMCAVGERSGSLADQLAAASSIFQTEFDRAIARVVGIIEPAMIIVVGAVVGIIGTTVITTVYSVLPQIGK
jgi:type IV pilus assembly protein PilC